MKRLVIEPKPVNRDVFAAITALYACWRLKNSTPAAQLASDRKAAAYVTELASTEKGEELLIEALARLSLMDDA
jgi:hypothetical protein